MRYESFVEQVDRLGAGLASAAKARLDAPVPTCPGWTVEDVVRHVAEVYEHKIASTELQKVPDPWPPDWGDRDPIEWFRDAHGRLLAMFRVHEPTDPSPTWWPADQTVGFWARRMAHETAIHGADAQLVSDWLVRPLDADLAVDGIDEILQIMLEGDWSEAPSPESTGQRVAVAGGDRSWVVTLGETSIEVEAGTADAPSSVGGDPSDVDLWLWGRAPDDAVEIAGSPADVALLRSRLVAATQ